MLDTQHHKKLDDETPPSHEHDIITIDNGSNGTHQHSQDHIPVWVKYEIKDGRVLSIMVKNEGNTIH